MASVTSATVAALLALMGPAGAPADDPVPALGAQLMFLQRQSLIDNNGFPADPLRDAVRPAAWLGSPPSSGAAIGAAPAAQGSDAERALRAAVVAEALTHLGQPYRWGGTGDGGFDCSGLVISVMAKHGVALPRVSREQAAVGVAVPFTGLQAGDLLFFAYGGGAVDHAGIYLGDGRFIHASSSAHGVVISELTGVHLKRLVVARRVLGSATVTWPGPVLTAPVDWTAPPAAAPKNPTAGGG